jgi:hypothetical protein
MNTKIVLPKPYLSYSAISLWFKNKEQFRDRYYRNIKPIDTKYTIFGKEIHEKIATDPKLSHIPRFKACEHEIRVNIEDIPIRGFIDSYNDFSGAFFEYKTGIKKPDGGDRWTLNDVMAHKQLPFYSLLIKEKYGLFYPDVFLFFLETYIKEVSETKGQSKIIYSTELDLTGFYMAFKRTICQKDMDDVKDWIVYGASQISEDYKLYKNNGDYILADPAFKEELKTNSLSG